jgi:hypothetical protein
VKRYGVLLSALVLVGCGSGSNGGAAHSSVGKSYADAYALAEAVGCQGFTRPHTTGLTTVVSKTKCPARQWHGFGAEVHMLWFKNNGLRDAYITIGRATTGPIYVEGNNWAFEVATQAEATSVAQLSGGTIAP